MIVPTIRASFARQDAQKVIFLLGGGDSELVNAATDRLEEAGLDALLDDPRTRNALLTNPSVSVSPQMIAYVLVRQSLLEGRIQSRSVADYVATVVFRFGEERQAYRATRDGEEMHYLIDIVMKRAEQEGRERFMYDAHLGNFSLWSAGLFPQHIEERESRRGAPPLEYYEMMGAGGFLRAADAREAGELGLKPVFRYVAEHFRGVRIALNRISDRIFFPTGGNPAWRLLRELDQAVG